MQLYVEKRFRYTNRILRLHFFVALDVDITFWKKEFPLPKIIMTSIHVSYCYTIRIGKIVWKLNEKIKLVVLGVFGMSDMRLWNDQENYLYT